MYGADTYAGGDNANNRETTFKATSTKLYVQIVTLSTKDNINLTNELNEGFKRPVYWNEYKSKIETKESGNYLTRFPLDASFKELIDSLFLLLAILMMVITRYFLPRVDITNYNVLIDGRNFYDQPINDKVKKYDEIRKIATGKEMITQLVAY